MPVSTKPALPFVVSTGSLRVDPRNHSTDMNKTTLNSLLPLVASALVALAPALARAQPAVAPAITTQPAAQIVATGAPVTFTVVATGTPAPRFQWYKNGDDIRSGTAASLTLSSASLNDAGVYTVRVSNSAGSVTSSPASLTVNAVAGTITAAAITNSVKAGTEAKLSITTAGSGLTYQWRFNGRPISGATTATLTLPNVGLTANGSYFVTVSTRSGPAASAAGVLTVTTDARLANIATRGHVGEDDEVLISGFVTRGTAPKKILLRGVGPTLGTQFSVTGALAAPTITLYRGNTVLERNSGWGGGSVLAAAFTQVGAFPLPAASLDAALLPTLDAGAYTAIISAPKGATGIALVEAYDADTGSPASEIINISTRAAVGAEAKDALIAGFAIRGTTSDTVLIRGVGPSLGTKFGMRRALGNSHVTVYDSKGVAVAANSVWTKGGRGESDDDDDDDKSSDLEDASDRVGAWRLPRGSTDSALLLTLAPGVYTAHVTGNKGGSGIALVEIYEVR